MPISLEQLEFPKLLDSAPQGSWPAGIAAQHVALTHFRLAMGWAVDCLGDNRVEGVHQLRVNIRRVRTALRTFASFWEKRQVRQFRGRLSDLASALGPARDLDVLELYLTGQEEAAGDGITGATEVIQLISQWRGQQQGAVRKALEQFKADEVPEAFIEYFSKHPLDMWQMEGIDE